MTAGTEHLGKQQRTVSGIPGLCEERSLAASQNSAIGVEADFVLQNPILVLGIVTNGRCSHFWIELRVVD